MERIIGKLARKYKTNNPFEIARELNILIRFVSMPEGTRGLYYRKLRRRFIVIDSELDENWQRIVCAHELGHDRLHPGLSRFWIDEYTFFNSGKYERQANLFALRLLTYNIDMQEDESLNAYLLRCGIPKELHSTFI
ncbi:ImmA/IrrE family metallo-endopeptidase [Paenibacillus albidus]|uniref:ImmA/IrrE family metallo-endopeptidase n=1 Tax=Paenibacillus albidus TaxID=2041023 RepID=A0A917FFM3_9BACL|nr:ImmA/IrrE family metallo-endopeptidase [Paenibacillus albidus]GGF73318.1 ImmA/IrrE family metallo-endopeptidase [Paenibacillus albidus]